VAAVAAPLIATCIEGSRGKQRQLRLPLTTDGAVSSFFSGGAAYVRSPFRGPGLYAQRAQLIAHPVDTIICIGVLHCALAEA